MLIIIYIYISTERKNYIYVVYLRQMILDMRSPDRIKMCRLSMTIVRSVGGFDE
jgi:hypothetical protein